MKYPHCEHSGEKVPRESMAWIGILASRWIPRIFELNRLRDHPYFFAVGCCFPG